jgi:hypothetical protein
MIEVGLQHAEGLHARVDALQFKLPFSLTW